MRKPPVPRAVPHRGSYGRLVAIGACGVLAAVHATRAVIEVGDVAYVAVLLTLGAAGAAAAAIQLSIVDDAISWACTAAVATVLGGSNVVALVAGLPGTSSNGVSAGDAIAIGSAVLALAVWAARRTEVSRPQHPRTPRLELHVRRALRGTELARGAPRGPARPAA